MLSNKERIDQLDIVRGFALLGILLVNMESFHSPNFIKMLYGIPNSFQGVDHIISGFFQLFIQQKFYMIFAFLFGLSYHLFIIKTKQSKLFLKRMIILFVLGILHLIFFWYGDILHIYALSGIALIFFYKLESRLLLFWSTFCLMLYFLLKTITGFIWPTSIKLSYVNKLNLSYIATYEKGSFLELINFRFKVEVIPVLLHIPFTLIPILGMVLLGAFAGKQKLYLLSKIKVVRKICFVSLIGSIPFTLLTGYLLFTQSKNVPWTDFLITINSLPLSIFYMCALFTLSSKARAKKHLAPLRYIGKMSLTNYLLQTIILISFFRTFHLFGKVSLVEGLFLTVVLFLLQLGFSYLWLTYHRMGPVEWILRTTTNNKRIL